MSRINKIPKIKKKNVTMGDHTNICKSVRSMETKDHLEHKEIPPSTLNLVDVNKRSFILHAFQFLLLSYVNDPKRFSPPFFIPQ